MYFIKSSYYFGWTDHIYLRHGSYLLVKTKFSRHDAADLASWSLSWRTHHSYWANRSLRSNGANLRKNSLNTSVIAYKVWLHVVSIHSLWLWSFWKLKKRILNIFCTYVDVRPTENGVSKSEKWFCLKFEKFTIFSSQVA